MSRCFKVSLLLVLLLASACVAHKASNSTTTQMTEKKTDKSKALELNAIPEVAGEAKATTKPVEPMLLAPKMKKLVDQAKKDLATRMSISDQQIEMLQAEFVTWRDSSAGCPQPGMQYLQVLTPGARILLRINDATYQYHSKGKHPPFLCQNPSSINSLPYQDDEA